MNPSKPPTGLSLKGRAVAYLSRREHSRHELTRKLAPHAESNEQLERLLDELERDKWLSSERFTQSLVHRKSAKLGSARLVQELKQHQIDDALILETAAQLKESEEARAQAIWQRKFGAAPNDPQTYARQMRFLLSRGFPSTIAQKVIGRFKSGAKSDFDELEHNIDSE